MSILDIYLLTVLAVCVRILCLLRTEASPYGANHIGKEEVKFVICFIIIPVVSIIVLIAG